MLPEAAPLGLAMAVAAGTMGGFIGRALTVRGSRLPTAGYWALILPTAVATAVILYALPISAGDGGTSASLRLTDVGTPSEREVQATIRIDPPDAAEDARWFTVTSWQGGGSVVQEAEEVGAGTYRTAEPIPVHGSWKSILRLHREDEVIGMPIFMPRDTAIPAEEVPAPPSFRRDFVLDKENLQREQKEGVSAALTTSSYLAVLAITVLLLLILFWGLRRIQFRLGSGGEQPPPRSRRLPAKRPATVVGSAARGRG
jgi:hypothetical protein